MVRDGVQRQLQYVCPAPAVAGERRGGDDDVSLAFLDASERLLLTVV